MLDELLRTDCARDQVHALGLRFLNRIGLAAGIDRTGSELAALADLGFGHVEIGTITKASDIAIDRSRLPAGFRVGVNFASSLPGLDDDVIDDYVAVMVAAWDRADFLVANLTSPRAGRTGDTPGVDVLMARLRRMQDRLAAATGLLRPLLIKISGGRRGDAMPAALVAARRHAFEGVVLVTHDLDRMQAARDFLACGDIVSVGGASTPECVCSRIAAGAALVQIHSAFVTGGFTRSLLTDNAERKATRLWKTVQRTP